MKVSIKSSRNVRKFVKDNKSILAYFKPLNKPSAVENQENNVDIYCPETVDATILKLNYVRTKKDSTLDSSKERVKPTNFQQISRSCPNFKWIPDTPFTVDAFKYGLLYGCSGYFLTHFHYDHYGGLSRDFKGIIYCSEITSELIKKTFGKELNIVPLKMQIFINIQGFDVMLIDANHCPGSVMILFRLITQRKLYLHTGDFRANSKMLKTPSVLADYVQLKSSDCIPRLTSIFLDTTYCSPKYVFPAQEDVISAVIQISKEFLLAYPKTLIVCGMYSVGKERFILGIAECLNLKVWFPSKQYGLVKAAADGGCPICSKLLKRVVADKTLAGLQVTDMSKLSMKTFLYDNGWIQMMKLRPILAWRPTGWTHGQQTKISSSKIAKIPCAKSIEQLSNFVSVISIHKTVSIFGAAYSEHSSFTELEDFVSALKPCHVQPTVFGGAAKKALSHIKTWLSSSSNPSSKIF